MAIRTIRDQAAPVSVRDTTVTASSQAVIVDLPFAHFVWNRPTEILVDQGGHRRRVRVVDVTRLLQLGFYGLAFVFLIASVIAGARRGGVSKIIQDRRPP